MLAKQTWLGRDDDDSDWVVEHTRTYQGAAVVPFPRHVVVECYYCSCDLDTHSQILVVEDVMGQCAAAAAAEEVDTRVTFGVQRMQKQSTHLPSCHFRNTVVAWAGQVAHAT